MTDEEVHDAVLADPEIRATDAAFWKTARVVMPQPKKTVTIRLDADLLASFRRQPSYQNAYQRDPPCLYERAADKR